MKTTEDIVKELLEVVVSDENTAWAERSAAAERLTELQKHANRDTAAYETFGREMAMLFCERDRKQLTLYSDIVHHMWARYDAVVGGRRGPPLTSTTDVSVALPGSPVLKPFDVKFEAPLLGALIDKAFEEQEGLHTAFEEGKRAAEVLLQPKPCAHLSKTFDHDLQSHVCDDCGEEL